MDRQDIDALLIGALYGELAPADEARLTAHLESHPTDRSALEGLKSARSAIAESRIFEVQLEPPQALSALLLQEAHRRAPKRVASADAQEGWFARLARSFMAHPAMAAAAMLVLVVGVAGTLYVNKGSDFADRHASAPAATGPAERAPDPAADPAAQATAVANDQLEAVREPMLGGAAAAGSADSADEGIANTEGYNAGLYEGRQGAALRDDSKARAELSKNALDRAGQDKLALTAAPAKKQKAKGIAVSTEQGSPKELESDRAKDTAASRVDLAFDGEAPRGGAAAGGDANRGVGGGGGTGTGTASVVTAPRAPIAGNYAQPPPPPAQQPGRKAEKADEPRAVAPTTTATARAPEPAKPQPRPESKVASKAAMKPPADAPAPVAAEPTRDDAALVGWAKGQHQATIALVKKGDCVKAAKLALGVSNRAPDYYAANMATDRALKACQSYITSERDKDAEKSAKSRAQKRVNADEPAINAK